MQGNRIFMEKVIALATENVVFGRSKRFGAAIVRGGKIVAIGATDSDDFAFCGSRQTLTLRLGACKPAESIIKLWQRRKSR